VLPCVDQDLAEVLVAVAWHTPAERALRQSLSGQHLVLWSHGLGTLIVFQARPVRGMLRCLSRLPQLLGVISTLRRCDRLVVAYPRLNRWDERSFDVVLARWLHVPVDVIGNPVDTAFWRPASVCPDFAGGHVLSIGRLEWQKGHAHALSIVSAVSSGLRLQVLAPEGSSYGQLLQRQADLQGHPQQLQLLLGLAPEQRRELVQQALCLLSWSETEYQSLAMLEALACGCPVVARPRGWLCHEPIPGVLVARSRHQAARYLEQLLAQPVWRKELGEAGRAYVLERHGLDVVAQQWNRLFAEMA
jgi:glycosyltransferase involved in cell wall biosynthesis